MNSNFDKYQKQRDIDYADMPEECFQQDNTPQRETIYRNPRFFHLTGQLWGMVEIVDPTEKIETNMLRFYGTDDFYALSSPIPKLQNQMKSLKLIEPYHTHGDNFYADKLVLKKHVIIDKSIVGFVREHFEEQKRLGYPNHQRKHFGHHLKRQHRTKKLMPWRWYNAEEQAELEQQIADGANFNPKETVILLLANEYMEDEQKPGISLKRAKEAWSDNSGTDVI
ncbi:hypothetical protein [Endozoicomonas ascidiicola]|uniref:hypothetical protein n=1 Tax=Endozoicomonas ascidiicola TaxID=1698521 RepID=UPI00082BDB46|nr:hypothetical protein [Endozoicomonas ascidiicola]